MCTSIKLMEKLGIPSVPYSKQPSNRIQKLINNIYNTLEDYYSEEVFLKLNHAPFIYETGEVTIEKLEEALDFMIWLEHIEQYFIEEPEKIITYKEEYKESVEMVKRAIKQYGAQIQPNDIENMQFEF
ncbi:MAG: hypothetical protein J0H68_09325 [Sphingobacteriia bacterium]|nr:hypothetical protein [Sphingobacteriia bacterium]